MRRPSVSDRVPVLSVTIRDCEVQTFRAGGPGGQNQNKRDTGVRVIHAPSGARGECREERSQLENKKRAFHRMACSPKFRLWLQLQVGGLARREAELLREVEEAMRPEKIKVEVRVRGRDGSRWIEEVEAGTADSGA